MKQVLNTCLTILLLSILFSSCQLFETNKISSESFFETEMESINWKDVDQYPVFSECEHLTEKSAQKKCFEAMLSAQLYQSISSEKFVVAKDLNDTVLLDFSVNIDGKLIMNTIKMDSVLKLVLPNFEHYILACVDSLQLVAPAYKRGIPVHTTFSLPIVIKTK